MSKHKNLALHINNTLSMMSLTSLSDPIGVPTLPGYTMLLPEIVLRVGLRSDFWGQTSQTTLLNEVSFRNSTGMFSRLIKKKVLEPATR